MKYSKTLRRRRKSRKNIAQRKKRSRKQKKRTTMKGGRENIAGRVINIIDRVIVILDQVQKREDKLKDAELKAKATSGTALKDDPKYEKYFKMLKNGVPRGAVEQKMRADGVPKGEIEMFLDQHAPQPEEGRGGPAANPFASRQGPMSGLLYGIRKQQGKPQRGNSVDRTVAPKTQTSANKSSGMLAELKKKIGQRKKGTLKKIQHNNSTKSVTESIQNNSKNNGPGEFNLNKFERNMEEEKRKKIKRLAEQSPQGQFAEKIKQQAQLRKREASKV